ncbi:MAG: DUF1573 domain-containing protein [Saprospiraceae bacterium]|nr:DUF1573 domain-containing protein [Saprospiraceae bacterium]
MKKIFASFFVVAMAVFFFASEASAQSITFKAVKGQGEDIKVWNYGKIAKGSNGVRIFKYTNTGSAPLMITNAKGSCGCTVPSYSKEPLLPGETAEIKVKYDTNRVGPFTKYVTLTTNDTSSETIKLKIQGTVEAEADAIPSNKGSFMGG